MALPFQSKTVHGEHQEVHIGEFSADKYGVITGQVERHRLESFDAPDWKLLSPASCPAVIAVPCVGVKRNYDEKLGMAIYAYTVQGLDPADVGFEERIFCSLEGSDNEEPIETHPDFDQLYKKYKGRPEPGTSKFGYFEKLITIDGKQQFNPLFGVTHFLTVGLIWTRTTIGRSLPQGLLAQVDCIDKPDGHGGMQPPPLKGKRNWLQLAPAVQERGNAIQIARRWLASGKNGWNVDVYGEKRSAGTR
jgi:hypothetical protein